MKPAKQLAATWSVDTTKQSNATGGGSCVIPHALQADFLGEMANAHLATNENETSAQCENVFKAGRVRKTFSQS